MSKPRSARGVLQAARDLLVNGWTQNALWRDESGRSHAAYMFSSVTDRTKKVSFCALGAIMEIDGSYEREAIVRLAKALPPEFRLPDSNAKSAITRFNDSPQTSVGDVLAVYDKAIADKTKVKVIS